MVNASKSSSKSGIQYHPGQKDWIAQIFSPGGPLWSLLGGGPNAMFEANANRAAEGLAAQQSAQGIWGQPLAQQGQIQLAGLLGLNRDKFGLDYLLQGIGTAGQQSRSSGTGVGILSGGVSA